MKQKVKNVTLDFRKVKSHKQCYRNEPYMYLFYYFAKDGSQGIGIIVVIRNSIFIIALDIVKCIYSYIALYIVLMGI